MSAPPAARGIRRAELRTPQPEAAVAFHRALLGWLHHTRGTHHDCWVGARLAATIRTTRDGEAPGWHLLFGGASHDSDLTGPDNTTASLCTARAQHGPWAPAPRAGELCWTHLLTTDIDRADDFWAPTLHWTCHRSGDAAETTHYCSRDRPIVGRGVLTGAATGWLCHFAVTDLDTATDHAARLGATLLTHTPRPDTAPSAVFTDPTGTPFALTSTPTRWGGDITP